MDHAQGEVPTAAKQDAAKAPNPTSNDSTSDTTQDQPPPNPRLASLQNKHASLATKLAGLQAERLCLVNQTKLPSGLAMADTWSEDEKTRYALSGANAVIKDHIRLLHEYNEIKDIGQGLMGLVAEGRGVRIKAVMEDFGMGEKD